MARYTKGMRLYAHKPGDHVSFYDIAVEDDRYAHSIATVHPNSSVGFTGGNAKEFAQKVAAVEVMFDAAKALVDRDYHFVGHDIVIPCGSHGEALRLMRVLRDAVVQAEGA